MEQPPPVMPSQTTCNFCGISLAPDQVLYTADARIACASCNAKVDLVASDMKVGSNILNGAIFAIAAAAISFVFNLFFILSISSMVSAIYALTSVNRKGDERFTQYIVKYKGAIYACAIIALVLDAIVIIISIMAYVALSRIKHETRYDY